jgi:hypothetical protein
LRTAIVEDVDATLGRLADAGGVVEISGRARRRVLVATEVFDARDAFAARAGQRG